MSEPSPEDIALAMERNGPPAKKRRGADLQQKTSYLPDIHRLLPQSPDAEQGILASLLLAPAEVAGLCSEKRLRGDHFHIPSHALIYRTLMEMFDANEPIDVITLCAKLRDRNQLDECGGPAFVTQLFTFLPTAANAAYYHEIVQEKATLREMIRVGTEYAARSYDEQGQIAELLDEFEIKVMAIRSQDAGKMRSMKELSISAVNAIGEAYSRPRGTVAGLSTGFSELDGKIDGLISGDMIIIAARPSVGKTALAMNMVENIAVEQNKPVGVFSLEMSSEMLVRRLVCSRARVNYFAIRDGVLTERDFPAITAAASRLSSAPIYIDDGSDLTIQEIRARARRWRAKEKIEALFIDYLGLIKSTSKRAQNSTRDMVSESSSSCKQMAKELGIPVIVLVQLNRDSAKEKRAPILIDMRDSGQIEQDADTVLMADREEMWVDEADQNAVKGQARVYIRKQRNGPLGSLPLKFEKEFTRFTNCHPKSEEDAQATMNL